MTLTSKHARTGLRDPMARGFTSQARFCHKDSEIRYAIVVFFFQSLLQYGLGHEI